MRISNGRFYYEYGLLATYPNKARFKLNVMILDPLPGDLDTLRHVANHAIMKVTQT
jgi:hypothetical protein